MKASDSEGIAIIGMTGRFPGAANLDEFWRNLVSGVESISTFADEELAASVLAVPALSKDPSYVPARGILQNAEWFDAAFFGMNPKEAEVTDPQQRLFLEAAWEVLENAGFDPERVDGPIAVYAGMGANSYYLNNLCSRSDLVSLVGQQLITLGNERDYLASRVAYKLNLRGPALSISTACSTSLVAVCQACQGLLNYQCDLALAGGVSVTFPQKCGVNYQEGGIISPDGHCRVFDARAQGTVFSDGIGVVLLKRLKEALNDGDMIYAVIKGFGVNNDGSAKVGFTAPSVDGQAEAIAIALAQAGFDPATISYVEAHGTATPLGDPIEIAALTQAFRMGTAEKNFCAIGSVKSNIGHLGTAAGVAGLIKTVLALKHKILPPSLHFLEPNPKIDFVNSPFFVNSSLTEWKAGLTPRRAGVSSFGFGGTNAHVVLEEAPVPLPSSPAREWQLLLLSTKTSSALDAATANLCAHFKANPGLNLADAAFTLQVGRQVFHHRRMLVCRDLGDAIQALEACDPKRILTQRGEVHERPVAFMFPGQGAQYVNMGADLYHSEPVFQAEIDRCAENLLPHLGLDLRQILCRAASEVEAAEDLLIQTRITQPALFVIEYALAKLWMSWGVKPRAMIGHSVGEYVAGCLAGVFTLEEALGVVARRAQLVQAQPGGAMLAVRLPEKEALPLLPEHLSLAAVNSPSLCVVSGPYNAIEKLEAQLKSKGIAGRRLETSHAFHSAMMDPVVDPLTKLLENVSLKEPSIPYISNVTGHWITASEALNPKYWASHMRQTVRFADGVSELLKNPEIILLEVGPGQTLTALASQHPARAAGQIVLPSLSSSKGQEISAVLTALGRLWLAGNPVDWFGFYTHEKRRRVPLPTYPFERKRFWAEPATQAATHATEGERTANATAVPSIGLSASADPSSARIPAADTLTSRKVPMATSGHHAPTATPSRKERILMMLTTLFQELSGMNGEDITPTAAFWEIGFDSLFLAQASLAIEKQFGARIDFRQMLKNQSTLNDLANYLNDKLPAEALAITPVAAARRTTDSANFSTGAVPPHPRSHSRAIAGIDESDRIVATTGQNKPQQITSLSPASVAKPVPRHETVARPPFRQSAQNTKERKPELIRLQAGDSGQEFIFILDNRSFDLLKLANFYLGEDLPLYASMVPIPEQTLRAASQRQFSSLPKVEDLAAEHTDLIMHQERTGPLLLAGHCFGGVLAFEVAHQLQRAGQQVQAVLMLDTWMTQPTSWWRRKTWLRAHSRRLLQRGPLYLWRKSLRWANLKREELALKHDLVVKDDFGAPVPWATVLRIYRHAVADYEPQVLPSRGILFVSKDDWLSNAYRRLDDSLGTAQWFKDGVEVVEVPGDHVTVLDEPHLPELAQCYKICLEKLRSKQISS